ncbi:twin-arginine translocation signal domain-containing protein [Streptomyces sp. CA-210063]|uniref:twin-arginine translocation signal domain-containing protein n=1 Tax=Streptomyces sp. CA-210063 TaxID=2801029 RepID=UPI003FA695C5
MASEGPPHRVCRHDPHRSTGTPSRRSFLAGAIAVAAVGLVVTAAPSACWGSCFCTS